MSYYLVKFVHTDMKGWQQHIRDHAIYLYQLVESGDLLVSGQSKMRIKVNWRRI